ncbi:MAG: hypothetical protein KatS3mg105_1984 [Gemmatales bacterium]|nr:MAG: hypothetical protein KatS3mg105_1984 [Gemmatales bacterium]
MTHKLTMPMVMCLLAGAFYVIGSNPSTVEPSAVETLFVANAEAAQPQGWGNIKGRVVWGGGEIPKREPLKVDADKAHCLEKGPLLSEEWVVNPKNKGVKWVFVWLDTDPNGQPVPVHPKLEKITEKQVFIDQPRCAFIPRSLAMRAGQELVVKNSSPVAHNVNWSGINRFKNPGGNVVIPPKSSYTIKNLKPDKLPLMVACNIHKWMRARVAVFDHPYFAVTDENGAFEIKMAPAGKFRLKVYHDAVGWRNGAEGRFGELITIKAGETTDVGNLDIK